jgi:hypothetical protein
MPWISGASAGRRAITAVGAAVLLAIAGGAEAADPAGGAEQLFDSARGDMKRGDFGAARDKLLESLQLEETAGTLFNLGLCEEKLGLLSSSLEHLRAALARAGEDDKRRPIMTALIGSLEGRVARVVLKRSSTAGPALLVTLDGRAVPAVTDRHEILVDAGEHQLVVRGPSGPPQTTALHVSEGETVVQTIAWSPATPVPQPTEQVRAPAAPPLAPPRPARLDERLGAVAVSAGAAALLGGAALGYMTIGSKISVEHHCAAAGCDEDGRRASADGSAYSAASTALTVTGLVGVGIGTYALLRPDAASRAQATARERSVGYIAGAVGAAALITSAIAGGLALSAKDELLDRCGDSGPCADPQGLDAAARGRTAATLASVALGVGVVGLGVATYSLLLRPRFAPGSSIRVTLAPSAVACAVRF